MAKLTNDQRSQIREFLIRQGLSFKPLQDEMTDHLSCDIEDRMSDGYSFEEAWPQAVGAIPDQHFQHIQTEVMETINKRFTLSQGFSFLALALLLISTLFKVLHMPLSGETLMLSFGFIAASLLTTSLSGIFLNKGKKGAVRVLAVILGMVALLIGFGFKLFRLPGADGAVILAVGLLIVSLLVNTVYVYRNASGEGNLLTFLHEKYTPGIERFFLLLLFPLVIYKIGSILAGPHVYVGNLLLLIVTFGAGLQLIALSWRIMEKDLSKRNTLTATATIISCLCLTLPFLGEALPVTFRVGMIAIFSVAAAWLACTMEEGPKKILPLTIVSLAPVLFLGWALIWLNVIPTSLRGVFFNLPVLALLVAGVILCRKHGTMRTYMLVALSSYIFEYLM